MQPYRYNNVVVTDYLIIIYDIKYILFIQMMQVQLLYSEINGSYPSTVYQRLLNIMNVKIYKFILHNNILS